MPKNNHKEPLVALDHPFRVAVIGSGNWGSAIAKVVAENTAAKPDLFVRDVNIWVHKEEVDGKDLTDTINETHENVKYLPGIKLPENLIANSRLIKVVKDADIIVFNLPFQYLPYVCNILKGHIPSHVRGISCIKGFQYLSENHELLISSEYIRRMLGIECGALGGANIASEVAKQNWSETTVAYIIPSDYRGPGRDVDHRLLKELFQRPYFHVTTISDVAGVSVCGSLKNLVALACGLVEGVGWGNNAAAAIQRVGLSEIIKFGQMFFPESSVETYYRESAGVADLITSCSGGRNVAVGKLMGETGKDALTCEAELLNGQSAQGILSSKDIYEALKFSGRLDDFPLFHSVYEIIYQNMPIEDLPDMIEELDSFRF